MKDLSLCVLSRNEEKNIEKVIGELTKIFLKNKVNFEIVAVSNNSTDNTLEILKEIKKKNKYLRIVSTKEQMGYGYAVKIGLRDCNGKFIGYIDGDGQVSAEDIFKVYKKISSDNSIDLCKAKRESRDDGLIRIIISKIYNTLFRILFGIKIKDINACPKIMKKKAYEQINLIQDDWFVDAEIIIKMHTLNKRLLDVPVIFRKRKQGSSNIKWIRAINEFLKNILKYRMNRKWQK